MKSKRTIIILTICILVAASAAVFIGFKKSEKHNTKNEGKYVYLSGTVTEYNTGPTAYDGGIIFKIDGTSVDIGGGLRASNVMGEVYDPVHVGDKVETKLKISDSGYLTIYECEECYVKKQ